MATNTTETTQFGYTRQLQTSQQGPIHVLTSISFIIVFIDGFAVFILGKCKRIPRHCLYLTISLIMSDAIGSAIFVLHQIIIYLGIFNDFIYYSRLVSYTVLYNITSASVAMMTLERVFALKSNLKYSARISTFKTKLSIFILWSIHPSTIIIAIVVSIVHRCSHDYLNCDYWPALIVPRVILTVFPILCDAISVCSNIIIFGIVRRHIRQINNLKRTSSNVSITNSDVLSDRQYAATRAIIQISLAYLVLHTPVVIHFVLVEVSSTIRHSTWLKFLLAFGYFCLQIHSFLNLFVIVFKLSECRMHVFYFFGRCCSRLENRAERIRIDIYNIVISPEYRRRSSQSTHA